MAREAAKQTRIYATLNKHVRPEREFAGTKHRRLGSDSRGGADAVFQLQGLL